MIKTYYFYEKIFESVLEADTYINSYSLLLSYITLLFYFKTGINMKPPISCLAKTDFFVLKAYFEFYHIIIFPLLCLAKVILL